MIYGQQFGRIKAFRWLVTMLLSFVESVFVFEPVKVGKNRTQLQLSKVVYRTVESDSLQVFVIAALVALLIKPKDVLETTTAYEYVRSKSGQLLFNDINLHILVCKSSQSKE